jgi:hypothetical protein
MILPACQANQCTASVFYFSENYSHIGTHLVFFLSEIYLNHCKSDFCIFWYFLCHPGNNKIKKHEKPNF